MNNQNKITTLLVGESGAGKTSLIARYIDNSFLEQALTTIGIDYRNKKVVYNGNEIKMEIWDTAGQERYHALPSSLFSKADAVAIVFSLTEIESFEKTEIWLESILKHKNLDEIAIAILGNKKDLENERKVSKEMIQQLENNKNIKCFEASAKTGEGVKEAFEYFIQVVSERKGNNFDIKRDSFYVGEDIGKKKSKCCLVKS